jgi:cardiolipin synthase A/B
VGRGTPFQSSPRRIDQATRASDRTFVATLHPHESTPHFAAFADLTVGTHQLALLKDGRQAFPAMLGAIAQAKRTVCVETYILRSDRTGTLFADALIERAQHGVEVNLLYDAWGSSVSSAMLDRLHRAGARTLAFHPMRFSGKRREIIARLTRRDHKKTLTVDSVIGFTGGLNLADDYASGDSGGGDFRDTHVRIEGPAAAELEYFFLKTWRRGGGAEIDAARYGGDGRRPDPSVQIVTSDERRRRHSIRMEYLGAIRGARERIFITNPYFLPTIRILHEFGEAAKRGVDVRIMVAGTTDVRAVLYASRSIYEMLLKAGVRMFEWRGRVLHAKTATIDGLWSTVGSSNLDYQSLRQNLEVNAIVKGRELAEALERMFEEDLEHCVEINQERWQRRSVLSRGASWAAYLLRDWL